MSLLGCSSKNHPKVWGKWSELKCALYLNRQGHAGFIFYPPPFSFFYFSLGRILPQKAEPRLPCRWFTLTDTPLSICPLADDLPWQDRSSCWESDPGKEGKSAQPCTLTLTHCEAGHHNQHLGFHLTGTLGGPVPSKPEMCLHGWLVPSLPGPGDSVGSAACPSRFVHVPDGWVGPCGPSMAGAGSR